MNTLETYFYYGNKLFEKLCSLICEDQEASEERCKSCKVYIMSKNYSFHFAMKWLSLMKRELRLWFDNRMKIVEKVKKDVRRDLNQRI